MPQSSHTGRWATCSLTMVKGKFSYPSWLQDQELHPRSSSQFPDWNFAVLWLEHSWLLFWRDILDIQEVEYWTASTTVLNWLQPHSCQYKVFVGTRVAEIEEVSDPAAWRYIDSITNPADDITRGKTLAQLAGENRWSQGPPLFKLLASQWPMAPAQETKEEEEELKKTAFCGTLTGSSSPPIPDLKQYSTYQELLDATTQLSHRAANSTAPPTANDFNKAELVLLRHAQMENFPEELALIRAGKAVPVSSKMITPAPEYDESSNLIRVGGRLLGCASLNQEVMHPVLLAPTHPVTKLLIQHCDDQLHHPGAECVFAELHRRYWILRGREAVRKHQRSCLECRKWRGKPEVPRMADLPLSSLKLFRPAFYSTGVDCFGPMTIKVGRQMD